MSMRPSGCAYPSGVHRMPRGVTPDHMGTNTRLAGSSRVNEPHTISRCRYNSTARDSAVTLSDLPDTRLLVFASDYEEYRRGVVHDREREGDALARWLWTVLNEGNEFFILQQLLPSWEEGAGVTVGTHSQEEHIKSGNPVAFGNNGEILGVSIP